MADGNGARPAAIPAVAGHWLQAEKTNFREQVINLIVAELSNGRSPLPQLYLAASRFENNILNQSNSKEEYISAIRRKIGILKPHQTPPPVSSKPHMQQQMPPPISSQPQFNMYAGVQQPMMVQTGNHAGRTGIRPNAQPNYPLKQNGSGMGIRQPQPVMSVNQHQWHGKIGGVGQVDWREDMFRNITCLKDSYLSELTELDRSIVLHPRTKEEQQSVSNEEAQHYLRIGTRLKKCVRNALHIVQLQKGDLNESHRGQFGKYHKCVLDLVQMYRTVRDKAMNVAAAAPSSSSQSQITYGVEAEAPPAAALEQSNGDNLQHEQPVVQPVSCPLESGALQQSHDSQMMVVQAEDRSAEAQSQIVNPTRGDDTEPPTGTGGTCSSQEHHVSSGTPPPGQQQNNGGSDEVMVAGQAAAAVEEGPTPVAKEETTALTRGIQENRSSSPSWTYRKFAYDMGISLKRVYRHEPEWPWERNYKRPRNYGSDSDSVLEKEIRAASRRLIDTAMLGARAEDGSTVVELLYSSQTLPTELNQAVNVYEMSARLLVPGDYPRSSPVFLDEDKDKKKKKGVPAALDVAFRRALARLPEPRSLETMAMEWDACARNAVVEFVHKHGPRMFTLSYVVPEEGD